jgi:hypothetical protein
VAPLNAQEVGPGMGDVFGTLGFAKATRGGRTHGALGGGASLGIANHLLGSFELTYVPLGSSPFQGLRQRMLLFDGTARYVFPLSQSKGEPYVLAGLGVGRTTVSSSVGSASDTTALFVWGAGFRYPLTERVGFRPELKAYTHDGTLFRVGVSVDYRFGQ